MAYKPGETELAGMAGDCTICLSEFADGDVLRVLPLCRHGFHSECVGACLAFSSRAEPSCPVCRASFHPRKNSPDLEP